MDKKIHLIVLQGATIVNINHELTENIVVKQNSKINDEVGKWTLLSTSAEKKTKKVL